MIGSTTGPMTVPPFLAPGARIGITCTSGVVTPEKVYGAAKLLERQGYEVRYGKTVGRQFHYFAGTDTERAEDLQRMLDDPELDAILIGRGGYGLSRIIDRLDFTRFRQRPKWVCGFSDITVLHSHLQQVCRTASLHSPMCGSLTVEEEREAQVQSFLQALSGRPEAFSLSAAPWNRNGTADGELVGGNLSLLAHLTGSQSELDTAGKILFIEDLGEHLYHIDRMMVQLRRAGKLQNLAALVVGNFTELEDTAIPFGQRWEEIVADKAADYGYPVLFELPCGHQHENHTLALGLRYRVEVTDEGAQLTPLLS